MTHSDVIVVGAGQAGLAVSHELAARGIEHVVLERDRVGSAWRGLWDGFCTNTPNWMLTLPGHAYEGDDLESFLPRDDLVSYLERYAQDAVGDGVVREGVDVTALRPHHRSFLLETAEGPMTARAVVVCTGSYQKQFLPTGAASLPAGLHAIGTRQYRNAGSLPEGAVLVVGSGQSGTQIAEDLVEEGRDVVLACGKASWAPRRFGGHDVAWWALETGFLDQSLDALPTPQARLAANVTASGVGGGHDLSPRTLAQKGVRLAGHFAAHADGQVHFDDDLAASIAWSDDRYLEFRELVEHLCRERGMADPGLPDPEPFQHEAVTSVPASSLGAVIFSGGFRPDYRGWIDAPGSFDSMGFPLQRDGASLDEEGLFFAGVHFLRKRKSSLFCGVGEDAAVVAEGVAESLG